MRVEPSRLHVAEIVVAEEMRDASNRVFLAHLDGDPEQPAVYKPVRGERELWDFPKGSLAGREVAVYEISRALGLDVVPATVWRTDGPFGPGSLQQYIHEHPTQAAAVGVFAPHKVPESYTPVVELQDQSGERWWLAHSGAESVFALAVLDAIVNNADRKGGHVIADVEGSFMGIDHGVCLHAENKLRTVLWGWAGQPIPEPVVDGLRRRRPHLLLAEADIRAHVDMAEWEQMLSRFDALIASGAMPSPSGEWPALPWPLI